MKNESNGKLRVIIRIMINLLSAIVVLLASCAPAKERVEDSGISEHQDSGSFVDASDSSLDADSKEGGVDSGISEHQDSGSFVDASDSSLDADWDTERAVQIDTLLCKQLLVVEGCTVASTACDELNLSNPLSVRECGTSDGYVDKTAVNCLLEAENNEEPFLLFQKMGPMLEGEFTEIAWLGIKKSGTFEVVQYITGGGGCCPALPRTLYRNVCSSISVKNDTTLLCTEEADSHQEVCACGESLWFHNSPSCTEDPNNN